MAEQQNFADRVALHLPVLTRVVRGLVRGDQMADDIVQQTVLKALTNSGQFRFESALKTWLTSIAMNEVRQAYRCRWRKRAVPLLTETLDVERYQPVEVPYNSYEANERDLLVRDAVSHLPHRYRSVVELCDFQSLPMIEAARKLGITLPAIKSRRHRARQKLLRLMSKLNPKSFSEMATRD
ncbi:MAG TPA: RNA polymerase sigma factor [Bryobacteraceae bacterium]|nr:RNA polymerase sigma factor [Bryobacteraceae bacterium]